MLNVINMIFEVITVLFDKVPILNKLKGYRSVLGLIGLAIVSILQMQGVGSDSILNALKVGFEAFTGFALLANGRK